MKKIDQLIIFVNAGQWDKAFSLAAKFPRLGQHKRAIIGAHEATAHPDFYRQINKDVVGMVEEGKTAIYDRYDSYFNGLPDPSPLCIFE